MPAGNYSHGASEPPPGGGAISRKIANLEELAQDKIFEFAFFGACIRLRGATGAPMRPVAMPLRSQEARRGQPAALPLHGRRNQGLAGFADNSSIAASSLRPNAADRSRRMPLIAI